MLFQCWASVKDGGPKLKHHWVNASFSVGNGCMLRQRTLLRGYVFLVKKIRNVTFL